MRRRVIGFVRRLLSQSTAVCRPALLRIRRIRPDFRPKSRLSLPIYGISRILLKTTGDVKKTSLENSKLVVFFVFRTLRFVFLLSRNVALRKFNHYIGNATLSSIATRTLVAAAFNSSRVSSPHSNASRMSLRFSSLPGMMRSLPALGQSLALPLP